MSESDELLITLLRRSKYSWLRSLAAFAFGAVCTVAGAAWTVRGYADQLATKSSVEELVSDTRRDIRNLENQTSAIRERLAVVETKTSH